MAWIFSLSAECGADRETAERFAKHFHQISWTLSGGLHCQGNAGIFQDSEANWWGFICSTGISLVGIINSEEAERMTELGLLLYEHLKSAPSFRYAIVGVEVDEFRYYSELIAEDRQVLQRLSGLAIAETLWNTMGCPNGFQAFAPGYLWIPYQGEVYQSFEGEIL